jgi:TPR repeat protein
MEIRCVRLSACLAAVMLAFGVCAGALADPIEQGAAAYARGDYATAVRLWRPMAEQGIADAQLNMATLYEHGQGVPQDYVMAAMFYRKAGEQGIADAQFALAMLYQNGQGVPHDDAAALGWFRKAADQGVAEAQFNLGVIYFNGQGAAKDYVAAHKWFSLAAAQFPAGDPNVKIAAGYRDQVAARMTPAQIAEAQKQADAWKPAGQSGQ